MTAKNPISLLQELLVARCKAIPVYTESGFGTEFICTVIADNITAKGYGSSKKMAKQEAAKKVIEILKCNNNEQFIKIPEILPTQSNQASSSFGSSRSFRNYIGELNEYSSQHRLSYPEYEFVDTSEKNEFIFSCTFGKFCSTGEALNKKDAKQIAAKKMLEILKGADDVGLLETETSRKQKKFLSIDIEDKYDIIKRFQELTTNIKGSMSASEPANIEPDPTVADETFESIDSLKEKLGDWGIEYTIKDFLEKPPVVVFNIEKSDFTLLATGKTVEEATYKVLQSAVMSKKFGCDFGTSFTWDSY